MSKSLPNQEAYYALKLAAIQRRKEFWEKLPDRLFVGLGYIGIAVVVICLCLLIVQGIVGAVDDHNAWVQKVDLELADLKSRPPVIQTVVREMAPRWRIGGGVIEMVPHNEITNVVTNLCGNETNDFTIHTNDWFMTNRPITIQTNF